MLLSGEGVHSFSSASASDTIDVMATVYRYLDADCTGAKVRDAGLLSNERHPKTPAISGECELGNPQDPWGSTKITCLNATAVRKVLYVDQRCGTPMPWQAGFQAPVKQTATVNTTWDGTLVLGACNHVATFALAHSGGFSEYSLKLTELNCLDKTATSPAGEVHAFAVSKTQCRIRRALPTSTALSRLRRFHSTDHAKLLVQLQLFARQIRPL